MTDTTEEYYRHECEVRAVLAMASAQRRRKYLDGVRKKRGAEAAQQLADDVKAEFYRQRGQR